MKKNDTLQHYDTFLLVLFCAYIAALILANLLNVSRLITFEFPGTSFMMMAPIGLLPYPITFFCTDVICELYGKTIASKLIWIGFWLNLGMCGFLGLGLLMPNGTTSSTDLYSQLSYLTLSCTFSSTIAYLITQNLDLAIFHSLKKLCKGRHLWLRNNASTMISQLVDTVIVVVLVKILTGAYPTYPENKSLSTVMQVVISIYSFKFLIALLDTLPLYWCVRWYRAKLDISTSAQPSCEH